MNAEKIIEIKPIFVGVATFQYIKNIKVIGMESLKPDKEVRIISNIDAEISVKLVNRLMPKKEGFFSKKSLMGLI